MLEQLYSVLIVTICHDTVGSGCIVKHSLNPAVAENTGGANACWDVGQLSRRSRLFLYFTSVICNSPVLFKPHINVSKETGKY